MARPETGSLTRGGGKCLTAVTDGTQGTSTPPFHGRGSHSASACAHLPRVVDPLGESSRPEEPLFGAIRDLKPQNPGPPLLGQVFFDKVRNIGELSRPNFCGFVFLGSCGREVGGWIAGRHGERRQSSVHAPRVKAYRSNATVDLPYFLPSYSMNHA